MKRVDILFVILTISFLYTLNTSAQDSVGITSPFEVAILKSDGTPLSQQERAEEKISTGPGKGEVSVQFKYKDQSVKYEYKATGENEGKYRFESPLFKDGSIAVGFRFPLDRNLPDFDAKPNSSGMSLLFKDKSKTSLVFLGNVEFVPQKPRKKLNIMLAEYGANDKWMDVTHIVKKFQIGDSLEVRPGNALFGKDPAPGVHKSMMLTYTLEDENDEIEELKEYREGSLVRIQFDPKEQYFRLGVKDVDSFEFNIKTNK